MGRHLSLFFAVVLCASCGPLAVDDDDDDSAASDDDDSAASDDDDSAASDDDDSAATDDDDSTPADADGDGFAEDVDCDDSSASTYPGADEFCDGVDTDCDGVLDEDEALDVLTWYADADVDGFGNPGSSDIDCAQPAGFVADSTDCNDADSNNFPGNAEVCDGLDNDCDALADNGAAMGSSAVCPGADCAAILAARPGLTGQGTYFINPLPSSSTSFGSRCDFDTEAGGWTIVDLSAAPEWQGGFTTWAQWSVDTAGPDVAPSPAYETWRGWFGHVAAPSTEFRRSTDCQIVDGTGVDEIWRMTGNYFSCTWYNTNCPMAADGTCSECNDPINQWIWGTCSHMVGSPDAVYAYACHHWWNSAPALGTDGAWCVAYRTP
jgi:hypothetical protein